MPTPTARERRLTQLLGEHAVAAELCRDNYAPVLLPQGWRGVDIFAEDPYGRTIGIQVKIIRRFRRWFFAPMEPDLPSTVFVAIQRGELSFYVVPGSSLYILINRATTPPTLAWVDIEPFRNQWHLLDWEEPDAEPPEFRDDWHLDELRQDAPLTVIPTACPGCGRQAAAGEYFCPDCDPDVSLPEVGTHDGALERPGPSGAIHPSRLRRQHTLAEWLRKEWLK